MSTWLLNLKTKDVLPKTVALKKKTEKKKTTLSTYNAMANVSQSFTKYTYVVYLLIISFFFFVGQEEISSCDASSACF